MWILAPPTVYLSCMPSIQTRENPTYEFVFLLIGNDVFAKTTISNVDPRYANMYHWLRSVHACILALADEIQ